MAVSERIFKQREECQGPGARPCLGAQEHGEGHVAQAGGA